MKSLSNLKEDIISQMSLILRKTPFIMSAFFVAGYFLFSFFILFEVTFFFIEFYQLLSFGIVGDFFIYINSKKGGLNEESTTSHYDSMFNWM